MTELETFAGDLGQEIAAVAAEEGREQSLPAAFTEYMIGLLTDAGEIDDGEVAAIEARGIRASGFSVEADEATLDVFVTDYAPSDEIRRIGKIDLDGHFRRLRRFVERSHEGLWRDLEESSSGWDMAHRISEVWPRLTNIRLTLLTNGSLRTGVPKAEPLDDLRTSHHVWDVERLWKLASSGRQQEPISVDLRELGGPIPALGPVGVEGEYGSYVMIIPGATLAGIYERFGPRLLELNVRSFLQARGNVNRGIQDTLKSEPGRFLAYNNGISMTARSIEEIDLPGGGRGIARIEDLQIVNGGQTTASLRYAQAKGRLDLSAVSVQAKLSIVEREILTELVPRISEYANSQNKVNMADFSANDPFHVAIEQLSRSVWAPNADGGHLMTRWFYERARGQYADALASERTPARQRQFKQVNPLNQKFTKTDLAKFENVWDQLPHIVALGAEKNFREFTIRLRDRRSDEPDTLYFQRLVAKAILFRRSEKIVGGLSLGGYRSQTVAYTLGLVLNRTGQRLAIDDIWRSQALSDAISDAISDAAPLVHSEILRSAGSRNVGEWAKKAACWEHVRDLDWAPADALSAELAHPGMAKGRHRVASAPPVGDEILTAVEQLAMEVVTAQIPTTWFELAAWAKITGNFTARQRSLAFSLGRTLASEGVPSRIEAVEGARLFDEASRRGFAPSHTLVD